MYGKPTYRDLTRRNLVTQFGFAGNRISAKLSDMKLKIYSILLTCSTVVLFFAFADKLPAFFRTLLLPGFVVAATINGSFHDRLIPGYLILGVFFNCAFYCALVWFGVWLFEKLRKTVSSPD
jgi:hypothetical protein